MWARQQVASTTTLLRSRATSPRNWKFSTPKTATQAQRTLSLTGSTVQSRISTSTATQTHKATTLDLSSRQSTSGQTLDRTLQLTTTTCIRRVNLSMAATSSAIFRAADRSTRTRRRVVTLLTDRASRWALENSGSGEMAAMVLAHAHFGASLCNILPFLWGKQSPAASPPPPPSLCQWPLSLFRFLALLTTRTLGCHSMTSSRAMAGRPDYSIYLLTSPLYLCFCDHFPNTCIHLIAQLSNSNHCPLTFPFTNGHFLAHSPLYRLAGGAGNYVIIVIKRSYFLHTTLQVHLHSPSYGRWSRIKLIFFFWHKRVLI